MGPNRLFSTAFSLFIVVAAAGAGYYFYGLMEEAAGYHRSEWAYEITGLEALYQKGYTGLNVTLAIVDTGIDMGHPEFKEVKLAGWKDYINNKPEPYDDNGHGSHVAGIIVAHNQLRGGAYNVELLVAKALDAEGTAENDQPIAQSIRWATAQGADIITLSLGQGKALSLIGTDTEDAVNAALDKGVYVVAAAGNNQNNNDEEDDVKSPASVDRVIAVGAIDEDKGLAAFSEHGDNDGFTPLPNPPDNDRKDPNKKVELVAPGVMIKSAWKEGTYADASGTSQATPFVAAGLALLLEAYPEFKRANNDDDSAILQMKELLMDSAEKISGQEEPHDDGYGYGLLRADTAFEDWG